MSEAFSPETVENNIPRHPLAEKLAIPGGKIGTLIVCGQGPVQDSATKVKLETLGQLKSDSVRQQEANTWMRLIARAAGELDKEGDVGLMVLSGRDTGGKYPVSPTEAELMREIIVNLFGTDAAPGVERKAAAEITLEKEAKNTIFNFINSANIIDAKHEANPNDPNLNNVWILGSHFHGPRLKILASLFGFDPSHVLSAEDVLMASSSVKEQQRGKQILGFDRQKALRNLLRVRLTGEVVNEKGQDYFQRTKERTQAAFIDPFVEQYLREKGVTDPKELEKQREEIKKKLFVEEQKDAKTRMKGERRWVRGLAMEADYVLPYSVYLRNDDRLRSFLLKFDSKILEKYGISKEELESITPANKNEVMKKVRTHIDPNRWSWQVVKAQWENEEYPPEVKQRFVSLGIPQKDIESLSKAEVPALKGSEQNEQEQEAIVWCMRHAPTQWNKDRRIQGHTQTHVLPEEVNAYLESAGVDSLPKPDLIVVSGLIRTTETAEALKTRLGWENIEMVEDPAFNERRWGVLEGKTHEEARAILLQDPEMVAKYPDLKTAENLSMIWDMPGFKARNGESLKEVAIRMSEGFLRLKEKYPGKNILLVTHSGSLLTQGLDARRVSKVGIQKYVDNVIIKRY